MKITKYGHACFTVEKDEKIVVVDPGSLSPDFISPEGVIAVVVTHNHQDHLDMDQIASIMDKNQDAVIIGHPAALQAIEAFETKKVQAGDLIAVGPFEFKFFGGEHARIHESIPASANLGVMINDLLYYPGDSFVQPERPVDTLAIPAAAPWSKIGEAMDFLLGVHPRFAFPTHDAILSEEGKEIFDPMFEAIAKANGIDYHRIETIVEI